MNEKDNDEKHITKGWTSILCSEGRNCINISKNKKIFTNIKIVGINCLVLVFFLAASFKYFHSDEKFEFCKGYGLFSILTVIVYGFLFKHFVIDKYLGNFCRSMIWTRASKICNILWRKSFIRVIIILILVCGFIAYLLFITQGNGQRLIPLVGLSVIILLGVMFSTSPRNINWRTVVFGFIAQMILGYLTISWRPGRNALECFAEKVTVFLSYGYEGCAFVFGDDLVYVQNLMAFKTFPLAIYFNTVVEILFYLGALQWICSTVGSVIQAIFDVTACEGAVIVASMLFGNLESAIVVKNYLELMTESEIHLLMAAGFANVSGSILGAYVSFGAQANHLLTASLISAPAAIMYSKLLVPETCESKLKKEELNMAKSEEPTIISAATNGAVGAITVVSHILVNVIAFVSLIAFLNGLIEYMGLLVGFEAVSLELLLGKLFIPLSWMLGVPWDECERVGALIGMKTVINELVAYQKMGEYKKAGLLSPRAETIATYALCGFTNPLSGGIMIGGLSAMAPSQRKTYIKVVTRAFFSGCAICFMTAAIAGILTDESNTYGDISIIALNQTIYK